MKLKNLFTTGAVALAISTAANAQETETLAPPTGDISLNQSLVTEGVSPTISWNITYPDLDDCIEINPDGTITALTSLRVKVRMLGAAVTLGSGGRELPVTVNVKVGNETATFNGVGSSVNSEEIILDTHFTEGQEITWKARIDYNNLPYYSEGSENVKVLRNGAPAPDINGAFGQGSVVDFLAPLLTDGKISIGNRDVLYLSELGTNRTSSSAYDLQDAITLITFEKCNENSN